MSVQDGRYLLTMKGCPHCKDFKEHNAHLLKEGVLKEKRLESLSDKSPWWDIFDNLKIEGTPSVVEVKKGKACEININAPESNETLKCTSVAKKVKELGSMDSLIKEKIS